MNPRITIMGHAGLFIEAGDQRVLVDPVLRTTALASDSVVHTYARVLDLTIMPDPTLLVVTHGHLDHFDPASLKQLDRTLPVIVPDDPALLHALTQLGFERLVTLAPWEQYRVDGLTFTAIPSHADIDEWGMLFDFGATRYLHYADAEPALADAKRIRAEHGTIDLASIKFQPAAPAHGVMRGMGAHFDKYAIAEWLECIVTLAPRFAFPYASGVRYEGRHAWLNRYAFPFRGAEIVALLEQRFGVEQRVATVLPGDIFELSQAGVRHLAQASKFVRHIDDGAGEPVWQPFEADTLAGVANAADREELRVRFEALLKQEIAPWIAQRSREANSPIRTYVDYGVVYQLVIQLGGGETLDYAIDFGERLRVTAGRHDRANYFAHLSGSSLLDVLRDRCGPELFYMSGDMRLYEKILMVRDDGFEVPAVQGWELFEQLPEPITHYLRHTRDAH